jgi:hypothetical protein
MTLGPGQQRLLMGAGAIVVAVAFGVGLYFLKGSVNRPPVVEKVEAQPAQVKRGESATLTVTAYDPDADALTFTYKADTGKVTADAKDGRRASYRPAERGPIADPVTVTVTDARGLISTASVSLTIEGDPAPEATAAPTEEPTAAPESDVEVPPPTPARTAPPTRPPTAPPTPPPATPMPPPNRAPILQEGSDIPNLGKDPIVLVASGSEPDNEPITFNWDFGACLASKNVSQFEAEVRLIGECTYGVATLTWTDPHGASATCQWTIHR